VTLNDNLIITHLVKAKYPEVYAKREVAVKNSISTQPASAAVERKEYHLPNRGVQQLPEFQDLVRAWYEEGRRQQGEFNLGATVSRSLTIEQHVHDNVTSETRFRRSTFDNGISRAHPNPARPSPTVEPAIQSLEKICMVALVCVWISSVVFGLMKMGM